MALLVAAVGCGHSRRVEGASAQLQKDQEDAADAIVTDARAYLEAREKGPAKPAPKGAIGARDFALESLLDSAQAMRIAASAEHAADDADADPGRAARVKTGADLLRRAAQVTANSARETLRSGDDTALKTDTICLRALLRAIKVDILALERQVNE